MRRGAFAIESDEPLGIGAGNIRADGGCSVRGTTGAAEVAVYGSLLASPFSTSASGAGSNKITVAYPVDNNYMTSNFSLVQSDCQPLMRIQEVTSEHLERGEAN